MKIRGIELRRVCLPLAAPIETSLGVQTEREALLVRVVTHESEGWGECVAMAKPLYSAEYTAGAESMIRQFLIPAMAIGPYVTAAEVAPRLAPIRGHPMAKAAIEMAVLDAELKDAETPLATYLGAVRPSIPAGVSLGITSSVEQLLGTVASYLDRGYTGIALTIKPGWDIEPVRAVRERFGDNLLLQVDAHGAYTLDDARHLARLDEFDLLLIEQPLPADDVRGHAALAKHLRTPICLDESITSARAALDAIRRGACRAVTITAGRVGGYLEARRVHDVCLAAGVAVCCGGRFETGLGRAANIALAALPGFTRPGDVSASDRYYHHDVTRPFVLDGGRLAVPAGPGIGIEPDTAMLANYTTATEWIPF